MYDLILCSVPYQRMAWEALKKSIIGLINKVNVSNIIDIVRELFQENIVRGRYDDFVEIRMQELFLESF